MDTCNYFAETCSEFVGANPQAFETTYWDVRYIDAYALAGGKNNDDKDNNQGDGKDSGENGDKDRGKDDPVGSEQGGSPKRPPPTPETIGGEFANPANIDEYEYLGCFACHADSALLLLTESDDMNLAKCIEHCREEGKGAFAGIQGQECHCGERVGAEMRMPAPGPCDRPCPGGPDTFCGGADAEGYKLYTVYGAVQEEQMPLPPPKAAPLAQDIAHEEYVPKVPDCPPKADAGSPSAGEGDPPASRPEDPGRPEGGSRPGPGDEGEGPRKPVVVVAGAPREQPPSKLSILAGLVVMGVMVFV